MHRQLRAVLMKPMMPSALREVQAEIETLADELVAELRRRATSFDGIADFAQHLPVAIVSRLVGLPEEGRQRMLEWARATFDALGPMNARGRGGAAAALRDDAATRRASSAATLRPSGWAAQLFAAADEGKIEPTDVAGMLIDYIAPSLDTTILGLGHLLFQLGRHPEQWAHDPRRPRARSRARSTRRSASRRRCARSAASPSPTTTSTATTIPRATRVLILFASGNRDERRYADPDRFDVTRDARDHLGFGHGVHRCAGSHLAQLEMQSLLRAMAARVRRIEVGAARRSCSTTCSTATGAFAWRFGHYGDDHALRRARLTVRTACAGGAPREGAFVDQPGSRPDADGAEATRVSGAESATSMLVHGERVLYEMYPMVQLDLEPARLPRLCDWLARVSARSSFARSEAVRPD